MHGEGIEDEGFHFDGVSVSVSVSVFVLHGGGGGFILPMEYYLQRATGIRWRQITNSGDNLVYSPEIDDQTSHHPSM